MSSYKIHEWFEILLLVAARNVAEDLKQVHDPVEGLHLGGNLRNPREGDLEAVITAWIRPQGNTLETQGNPMVPTSWSPEHSAVPCTEQEETRH